jgi:cell division protein FtsQ
VRAAVALGRRGIPRAADLLRWLAAALTRAVRPPSRAARARLIALGVVVAALGALYMLWFRDSSLVRVERVTVTGLSGTDAPRQRVALIAAATRMTTLHVDEDALRRALGAGATIEALHVSADFPHGLHIEVVEKAPVAVLVYGRERAAVGAGGVLLPGVQPIPTWLPAIDVGALPEHGRLGHGRASRLVAAAAAAPAALRPRIERLRELPVKGLVAYIRSGPEVILGPPVELGLKWTAAAAILADPTSRGASYIDVRLPDRPVAGGLVVTPPPGTQLAAPPQPAAGTAPSGAPSASPTTPGASATPPASSGTSTGQSTATSPPQQTVPPSGTIQATPAPSGGAQPRSGP